MGLPYLVVLIHLIHPPLTLFLGDDLSSVFHDDLVGAEATIAPDAVAPIARFYDLNTNAEPATLLGSILKELEGAVGAMGEADIAVRLVALVQHDAVLALVATALLGLADALRLVVLEVRCLLPVGASTTNESV
jgi:hypothetical protein